MPREGERGVVLMNMGGPEDLDAIRPYLCRVLSDRHLVRMPAGFLYQPLLARLIAGRRARKVRARYAAIGGGSPLLGETRKLAAALAARLDAPVAVAMRYSEPSARQAADQVIAQGATHLVGLPLYPQYSSSTTASSAEDFARQVKGLAPFSIIDRHYRNEGYLDAMAALLRQTVARLEAPAGAHILFTAHSIPTSYTAGGDPYVDEVGQTVKLVAAKADTGLPHSLAFQSAVRFGEWHGPSVEEELERLVASGVTRLIVQPVSFVSENLETMYDLDICFRKRCLDRGIRQFERAATPGPEPAYIEGLAGLVRNLPPEERTECATS